MTEKQWNRSYGSLCRQTTALRYWEAGWQQQAIADEIGVTQGTVSKYVNPYRTSIFERWHALGECEFCGGGPLQWDGRCLPCEDRELEFYLNGPIELFIERYGDDRT